MSLDLTIRQIRQAVLMWFRRPNPTLPPRPALTLRVGVIGHRPRSGEVFAIDAVRSRCEALFVALSSLLEANHGAPYSDAQPSLTLITSLAEGADQIATEALFTASLVPTVSRRLEAVLPFGLEQYASTFTDVAAQAALHDWLGRADAAMVLDDWRMDNDASDALAAHRRDRRYATAGEIVLRQSDVLIAVWDGQPARGRGGTADTVTAAIGQGKPVVWISPVDGKALLLAALGRYGDVFALAAQGARALDSVSLAEVVGEVIKPQGRSELSSDMAGATPRRAALLDYISSERVPTDTRWGLYQNRLVAPAMRRLDLALWRIGASAAKLSGQPAPDKPRRVRASARITAGWVKTNLDQTGWPGLPSCEPPDFSRRLKQVLGAPWAAADAIATRLGNIYRSYYVLIFSLGALAVVAGLSGLIPETGMGLKGSELPFVVVEFALLLATVWLYYQSRRQSHHLRWLQTRELSEQFRAHWALALTGLGGRRTLGPQAQWNAWLFNAYAANIGAPHLNLTRPVLASIASSVRLAIVKDQMDYHGQNAARLGEIHRHLEHRSARVLILALATSAALVLVASVHHFARAFDAGPTEPYFNFAERLLAALAGGLPAVGAAYAGLRYHGDFERFAERSHDTRTALHRIEHALAAFENQCAADVPDAMARTPAFETLRDIVTDLERVLLSDLEDWRFVYRARPSPEPG